MKIFMTIRHSIDPKFYYANLWQNNFYPALQQLGHEIIESQVDLISASRFMQVPSNFTQQEQEIRDTITQKIVDEVYREHKRQHIDLFLSYFYNAHFNPEGFDEIHRLGIPTVNFYCNSIYQFELVAEIAAKVNFSWHPEKEARSLYLKVDANPVWVQLGADPELYHPVSGITRQAKACFVGQRYADRDRYLAKLIANQVPVDIYGSGWVNKEGNPKFRKTLHKYEDLVSLGRLSPKPGSLMSYTLVIWQNLKHQGIIPGIYRTLSQLHYRHHSRQLLSLLASAHCGFAENISHTLAQYEVVLNFSNVWADGRPGSALIPHVRLRDFEAPMCRTCYLTGYTDEIAEFYELGKEIETYRSSDELIDKTKFYLSHPSQAEQLRQAGYKRARSDHTWRKRFEQLLRQISL